MRLPFVLRSTMEAELDAQLGRYNDLMGTKERLIRSQEGMIAALSAQLARLREANARSEMALSDSEAQLARLREHFEATCAAKDRAYDWLSSGRDAWVAVAEALDAELRALRPPSESAALDIGPLDSFALTIDPRGMYGSLPGVRADEDSDDPRENLNLSMGLQTCRTSPSSPIG